MNLHIVPDSKFTGAFYKNLSEANLLAKNKLIVRSNNNKLAFIKEDLPFAPLYTAGFESEIGRTADYDKVFLHQLTPLMYRWVATHSFRQLNWMVWGTDLYNLPFMKFRLFENETHAFVNKQKLSYNDLLYHAKVYITNMAFMKKAYSRVDHVLTWMNSEYAFAQAHLPLTKAKHQFFFYENQVPYETLDNYVRRPERSERLSIVVGNSGTPSNNHLDAIRTIADSGIQADLTIPVSYGEPPYIRFLKDNTNFYKNGTLHFIDRFMEFHDYVSLLNNADALVMNHIRPQGYGNIFMMMYLDKPVLFNERNISLPDLKANGFHWQTIQDLRATRMIHPANNREAVRQFLSHDKLIEVYRKLFS